MKEQTHMAVPERTYEMHGGEWCEVEPQSNARPRSAPRGLGALAATVCAVLAIVVFGIVATAAALVLLPAGLLAAWGLRALTVWGLRALPVRRPEAEKLP
jgi:hypothetical protein